MINLIPTEEKKRMKTYFWVRLLTIGFIVFGCSILIGAVALLPAYFHVTVKNSLAKEKSKAQQETPLGATESQIIGEVNDLNKKLELIEKSRQAEFVISERVINNVVEKKMPDIKITEIGYEYNATKGKEIRISGEALSRERLLLFRLALERDPAFKKVDLPVSNFVRGSNIHFFLTLVPA